jgi:hypothetical protein
LHTHHTASYQTNDDGNTVAEKAKLITDYRNYVQFEVGDKVYLKVALTKGVMKFGENGKLIEPKVRQTI